MSCQLVLVPTILILGGMEGLDWSTVSPNCITSLLFVLYLFFSLLSCQLVAIIIFFHYILLIYCFSINRRWNLPTTVMEPKVEDSNRCSTWPCFLAFGRKTCYLSWFQGLEHSPWFCKILSLAEIICVTWNCTSFLVLSCSYVETFKLDLKSTTVTVIDLNYPS